MNPRKLPELLHRGLAKTAPGYPLREPADARPSANNPFAALNADLYSRLLRRQSRASPNSRKIAARLPQRRPTPV